ncbi:hypothetical protein ACMFMG_006528 [Clarireedia jacksonii]
MDRKELATSKHEKNGSLGYRKHDEGSVRKSSLRLSLTNEEETEDRARKGREGEIEDEDFQLRDF